MTVNIATASDVEALDAQLDPYMEGANAAVSACANLSASDRKNWAGFYAGWKAVHTQWDMLKSGSHWYNPSGVAAELMFLNNVYSQMRDYADAFPARANTIRAACSSYTPPGEILNQLPGGKPKNDPSDIDTYLGYAKTAGEVALIGVAAYGLYKIAGILGDIKQTSKRLVS